MTDRTHTTDLLPCPFCGEVPDVTKHFKEPMWRLTHRVRRHWSDSLGLEQPRRKDRRSMEY